MESANLTEDKNLVEKAGSVFSGVKEETDSCSQAYGWINWSGIYGRMNKCAQRWAFGLSAAVFGIWFVALAGCIASTAGLCGWNMSAATTIAQKAFFLIWGFVNNPNCQWTTVKLSYPFLSPNVSC